MDLGLAGRAAAVAASSRGLGRATARALAVVAEVASAEDCRFVDTAAAAFGRLDILVTNTGGPRPGALASFVNGTTIPVDGGACQGLR